jgi:carboxypeptidase Taq
MNEFLRIADHYQQISRMEGILQMLWWDMETYMPPGAGGERSEQVGVIAAQIQKLWADPEFFNDWNRCNESLNRGDFSQEQKSQIQKLGLDLAKRRAVSVEFAGREARLQANCQNEWKTARQADDFSLVQTSLHDLVQLNCEKADLLRQSTLLKSRYGALDNYSILFDSLEPGFHADKLRDLFTKLEAGLKERLPKIMEARAGLGEAIPMSVEKQKLLYSKIPAQMGMDVSCSRLDESTHPFCGGTRGDVRITTRYFAHDFSDSMFSVIHETGHGLYEQGIPRKLWHTPLGQAASFGIHESQSRFLPMVVSRSGYSL